MAYARRTWGARGSVPKDSHPKTVLVIHHAAGWYGYTGSKKTAFAAARAVDTQHLKQGWDTIGYSFLIAPAKRGRNFVFEGRGWHGLPAAQQGHNSGTIAVCVLGNYEQDKLPYLTKRRLISIAKKARKRGIKHLKGHRDFGGTACPGRKLQALIPAIRKAARLR